VIYRDKAGIVLPKSDTVHTVYVEMKNKHNTMNSAAGGKTYIKMQNQLLQDDDCACFLVEAIAKQSQNIAWSTTVDKKKVQHKRIRRVSLDKFYELVTGDPEAFYKLCIALPEVIGEIIDGNKGVPTPIDTVILELKEIAGRHHITLEMALYMLGFGSYNGFMVE
jgi:hypothetical protein